MEIRAVDGKLTLTSLFGPLAVGYAIGGSLLFIPMFLLVGSFMMSMPMVDQAGHPVNAAMFVLPMVIMVPLILTMQGLIFGGLTIIGLGIFRRWGTLRVVSEGTQSPR